LPLRGLPLLRRHVAVAGEAPPVGLHELALERVRERLRRGVRRRLAVSWSPSLDGDHGPPPEERSVEMPFYRRIFGVGSSCPQGREVVLRRYPSEGRPPEYPVRRDDPLGHARAPEAPAGARR